MFPLQDGGQFKHAFDVSGLGLVAFSKLTNELPRVGAERTGNAKDWYGKHGMKQARKERVAPSHLRFNHEDPVMPGSLRRPKEVAPALLAPPQVIQVRSWMMLAFHT